MTYQPALDGLRALAVIAVLFFHGEVGASGGFLGVSVFFTLSGYLITSLLLAEHRASGTISLRDFYARRLRRLLPASLLCIALVLALGFFWVATQRRELRGDLLAALLDVVNWRFAFSNTSYQELFIGEPSPVAHFWSLAIEEQFYVVLPVLALVSLRSGRRTLALVAAGLLAASVLATVATTDRDLVYNGTHTRAAELLLGVLLAVVPLRSRTLRRGFAVAGIPAFAALTALVLTTDVTDDWLYQGGLAGVGVLSAVLIGAITTGRGLLVRLLSRPMLVGIGRISYGLYLFHWPLYLVLDAERTGTTGLPLFSLRLGASLLAALISFVVLEQPVRARRRLVTSQRARISAATAFASVVALAVVAVPAATFSATDTLLAEGDDGLVVFDPTTTTTTVPRPATVPTIGPITTPPPETTSATADTGDAPDDTPTPTPAAAGPATDAPTGDVGPTRTTVLVVGSNPGPIDALEQAGYEVIDGVQRGCPIASAFEIRLDDGTVASTSLCDRSADRWAALMAEHQPDVVVVSSGPLDHVAIRRWTDAEFSAEGDLADQAARYDSIERDLRAAIGKIVARGRDVWIVDHDPHSADSAFDDHLARLLLTDRTVRAVVDNDAELVEQLSAEPGDVVPPEPFRVMVIGDSVSLNFARAISDAAPDELDVVWAGQNGCPFARVAAVWISFTEEWVDNDCEPFDTKLPPLLDEYTPDVVVLLVSLRELVDQRYPGDDRTHSPGDAAYVAFHDAEMEDLVEILMPRRIPLLVGDTPPIGGGFMATPEMTDPARLRAWNAQIARWSMSWKLVEVYDYRSPLLEEEERTGSMRPDGVHPDLPRMTELAREIYVPRLIEQTAALRLHAFGEEP